MAWLVTPVPDGVVPAGVVPVGVVPVGVVPVAAVPVGVVMVMMLDSTRKRMIVMLWSDRRACGVIRLRRQKGICVC